jgi:rRNA maturation endonuclease Nob1
MAEQEQEQEAGPAPAPSDAPKLRNLVLDAGPIIKGVAASLLPLADRFWTTPEVIQEVRDQKARKALETLPYELQVGGSMHIHSPERERE